MNKTEMKKIFSKLSNIQQKVLIKALRKVSVETFNDFCNSNDIKNFNPNDMNWKYDGFVYCFNKRMDVNGKKLISFHYAKNILTNEEIKFSINDYIKIFSNKQNKLLEYAKIHSALNTVEKIIFNQIKNIIFRINHGMYFNWDVKIKQILETSDKIKELKNYEAIVNLLYYDLPLSDELKESLHQFFILMDSRKDFNLRLQQNPEYDNILTLMFLSPFDNEFKMQNENMYNKYAYIINFYERNKYLSKPQLNYLCFLFKSDFKEINKMFNYLYSIKLDFDDELEINNLRNKMENEGLLEDEIKLLNSYYDKYKEVKTYDI